MAIRLRGRWALGVGGLLGCGAGFAFGAAAAGAGAAFEGGVGGVVFFVDCSGGGVSFGCGARRWREVAVTVTASV